jgi:hypothetical protein
LFIGLAFAGWTSYFAVRIRREKNTLAELGFRRQGLAPTCLATSSFGVAALAAMALITYPRHGLVLRWPMLLLLVLYPVWGTLQQLLVQGIFVRSVTNISAGNWPKVVATVTAALLFGTVHLPDLKLAAATCCLGAVFTLLYLRWRNLWPLGLWHGWLGVFFYYWMLGRDPWSEVFGTGT